MAQGEGLIAQSKSARFEVEPGTQLVSRRNYNMIMGLTVCWGLLVNAIMVFAIPSNVIYGIVAEHAIAFLIGYLVLCIAGILISYKSDNPAISFVGYNMVVVPLGLVIAFMVDVYVGVGASSAIWQALAMTCLITAVMVLASMSFPNFFAKIGGVLFIALIGIIVVELIFYFLGISQVATSYFAAAIFALYIGFDYWRAQQYQPTVDNAIDCAVDLYMDIALLFLRLLEIFGNSK